MKEKIMQLLVAVVNALNTVSVCGKANLANLSGSICALEEIGEMLSNSEVSELPDKSGG